MRTTVSVDVNERVPFGNPIERILKIIINSRTRDLSRCSSADLGLVILQKSHKCDNKIFACELFANSLAQL